MDDELMARLIEAMEPGETRTAAETVFGICMEHAAKIADGVALRLRDEQASVMMMHGALMAAAAIRDHVDNLPHPLPNHRDVFHREK